MGMYDNIRCKHPLPDAPPAFAQRPECLWQTKDLDCDLSTYEITEDGRLVWVDSMFGDPDFEPKEATDVHQDIVFYNSNIRASDGQGNYYTDSGEDYESADYRARFTNGRLEWIREAKRERGPALPYSQFPQRTTTRETQIVTADEMAVMDAMRIFDDDGAID